MADLEKDPDEIVAFTWDWSADCTVQGTTLSSVTWIVPSGITKDSETLGTRTATIVVTGGTTGRAYPITCRAGFANGESLDFTKVLAVKDK